MDIKKESETTRGNFSSFPGGTTEHKRVIIKEDEDYIQYDKLITKISLNTLSDSATDLLSYWCVEAFDNAYIDWGKYEVVLEYQTEHYVSKAHAMQVLKDPATLTTLEED